MGANHHHYGGLLWLHLGNHYAAHLLWPAASSMLVRLRQGNGSHTGGLNVITQQIYPSKPWYKSPKQRLTLATSSSRVGARKSVMLVMPTI